MKIFPYSLFDRKLHWQASHKFMFDPGRKHCFEKHIFLKEIVFYCSICSKSLQIQMAYTNFCNLKHNLSFIK